jgi:H+/Cl- antiporter ClcA
MFRNKFFRKLFHPRVEDFDQTRLIYILSLVVGLLSALAALGGLIYLFPPLYGEGYDTIMSLLQGDTSAFTGGGIFSNFSDSFLSITLFMSGLAGVMAGVMHAPLTAIFLIAENRRIRPAHSPYYNFNRSIHYSEEL